MHGTWEQPRGFRIQEVKPRIFQFFFWHIIWSAAGSCRGPLVFPQFQQKKPMRKIILEGTKGQNSITPQRIENNQCNIQQNKSDMLPRASEVIHTVSVEDNGLLGRKWKRVARTSQKQSTEGISIANRKRNFEKKNPNPPDPQTESKKLKRSKKRRLRISTPTMTKQ